MTVTTELVLLGTAGAPLPVAGRAGISSALIVGDRVFVIDCGRGSPSAFADAGLDFTSLEAVFLSHFHVHHIGDLAGMLLYPWGVRTGGNGSLPPIRVYGPSRPKRCRRVMPLSIARRRSTRRCQPLARRIWSRTSSPPTHTT